jgi:hypothetical protein
MALALQKQRSEAEERQNQEIVQAVSEGRRSNIVK